jgi:exonuclease VII large subunit
VQQLNSFQQRLENLDPRAVLRRGYSITRLKQTNRIITQQTEIQPGDMVITELDRNKNIESEVTQIIPSKESQEKND